MTDGDINFSLEAQDVVRKALGRIIKKVSLEFNYGENGALLITFEPFAELLIYDEERKCCERRYLSADGDDMGKLAGGRLEAINLRHFSSHPGEYDVRECCFIELVVSGHTYTLSARNDHNGFYSGFRIGAHFEEGT